MNPPIAKRVPVEQSAHGVVWTDDYAWLRADNWLACVDEPESLPEDIKAYLQDENSWYESYMADTKPLQEKLLSEMRGRIQADDESLPDADGPWCYLERYNGDDEHPSYFRRLRTLSLETCDEVVEHLLIDFNLVAQDHEYFAPGDVEHSPSHTHLAWSADTTGSERYRLTIRNLLTGQDEETIEDVESVVWGSAQQLFYTRVDEDLRPSCVYRHELGSDSFNDVLIYEETDKRFFCSVWTSLSEQFVFISSDMSDQSEVWFIPTDNIYARPILIEPRTVMLEYSVEHQCDRFLILTNADGAIDFKIVETPCASPGRKHWRDWLPHHSGRMVLDVYAYRDWIMWMERENALPRICYRYTGQKFTEASKINDFVAENSDDEAIHRIEFSEEAFALSLEPLLEFDQSVFRLGYESPSTPAQTYSYDMRTGERALLKEEMIPSGHNQADYQVKRVYAESLDGEAVPVTILYHRNTRLDGTAPCWLTAYGAYGSSSPATFSSSRLSLIDRGFVFALAHVRGGQEKGRAWYEAARFGGKHNSIDDLIAVGQYLVKQRYTGKGKIALSGGSAGGLLVGAALNRPDNIWGAVIADVPFVDALNTMLDASLPLTPTEWSQWGNPLDDEQAFKDILSYSPYDNVQSRAYPPMLVTAGVSDPRVTYWEPAKWVAKHRHLRSDDNVLLLKTNMHSGHFGETGRYASLTDIGSEQAFVLKVLCEQV